MIASLKEFLYQLGVVVAGVLLAYLLILLVTPEPAQPEPIVVVCTWTQGCHETNQETRQ